jgi:transcriptional regulator with XRE-family HTH domain
MEARRINQPQLAKLLKESPSSISQKIGGNLRVTSLFDIAKALDVNPAVLVDTGGETEEQLRLLCIKAIVSAPLKDLLTFRAGFAHLFVEAPADKHKSRSSL